MEQIITRIVIATCKESSWVAMASEEKCLRSEKQK